MKLKNSLEIVYLASQYNLSWFLVFYEAETHCSPNSRLEETTQWVEAGAGHQQACAG